MRGILLFDILRSSTLRIIPACAGNTDTRKELDKLFKDHPRLCGEYAQVRSIDQSAQGSSPLVRGIRKVNRRFECIMRIIPACAGNTTNLASILQSHKDHPRLCGEYLSATQEVYAFQGSSPLVRGILVIPSQKQKLLRIIPACAGNTLYLSLSFQALPRIIPACAGNTRKGKRTL